MEFVSPRTQGEKVVLRCVEEPYKALIWSKPKGVSVYIKSNVGLTSNVLLVLHSYREYVHAVQDAVKLLIILKESFVRLTSGGLVSDLEINYLNYEYRQILYNEVQKRWAEIGDTALFERFVTPNRIEIRSRGGEARLGGVAKPRNFDPDGSGVNSFRTRISSEFFYFGGKDNDSV